MTYCERRYVEPSDASIDLTLTVADTAQQDFMLKAICMTEIDVGRVATRHVRVRRGMHHVRVVGDWNGRKDGRYIFEVTTRHDVDVAAPFSAHATVYETARDKPLQDRLRIEWKDEP